MKIDMGIAIVCMTNHTAVRLSNEHEPSSRKGLSISPTQNNSSGIIENLASSDCPLSPTKKNYQDGEFVYTENEKGFILSAYFYGYIFTQVMTQTFTIYQILFKVSKLKLKIPGGFLSYKFGGRYILCLSMFIGSIITLFIPLSAFQSTTALFTCLFFIGAAHVNSYLISLPKIMEKKIFFMIFYIGGNMGEYKFFLGILGTTTGTLTNGRSFLYRF